MVLIHSRKPIFQFFPLAALTYLPSQCKFRTPSHLNNASAVQIHYIRIMNIGYILITLLLLAPFLAAATDTLLYRIYDTQLQEEISVNELAQRAVSADVLFFGEEHNDSVAHVLQHELFRYLHALHTPLALSLEMFTTDDQLVLDEYCAGLITEKNLASDVSLWKNYPDYRPLVEYARENGLRVVAANAPRRYTNRVTRAGLESLRDLPHQSRALLAPLPIDTLTGAYYEKFASLMGGHENMGSMKIYQSQNLWDATMAYRIHLFLTNYPNAKVLHLAGKFHTDEKLGTVAQLAKYAPHLRVLNISCFSHASFKAPDWDAFDHLADFIILTNPAIPRTY